MVDKPYRSAFLKFVYPYLSKEDKAATLKYTWIQTEFQSKDPNISKEQFLKMFRTTDPKLLMDENELSVFQSLPSEIEIYRGVGDRGYEFGYKGISWTLKESTAKMFALRFSRKGIVYKYTASKDMIITYFDGEDELILDYRKICKDKISSYKVER